MMGSPPKYSAPDPERGDQSLPLLGAHRSLEHVYPPSTAQGHDNQLQPVVYVYEPKYPATGKKERVMASLSRSKEDTITTVQSAITPLADVDRTRIHFHTLVNPGTTGEQEWARVLDDVWAQMVENRPQMLQITVEEDPKARAERISSVRLGFLIIFGGFLATAIILFNLGKYVASGHK